MLAEAFFDASVLLYILWEGDWRSPIATDLLFQGGTVNVQVLNEFTAVARRKLKMDFDEIQQALAYLRALCGPVHPMTLELHEQGISIARRTGYTIYDSLIVSAAIRAGCTILYSEDMQHGQKIDGLMIVNPFREL
ncbi:MAG TPA: PIN domain-containing protein [Acidobacteriaceae bacterium]